MVDQKSKTKPQTKPKKRNWKGITCLTVGGFKSISQEQSIEIRPLTILAGANSSGKSSIMQPLLLLKQTLEATYDPGVLLLNGPNVKFSSSDQLLSRLSHEKFVEAFHVGIEVGMEEILTTYFRRNQSNGLDLEQTMSSFDDEKYRLYPDMPQDEINQAVLSTLFGIAQHALGLSANVILTRNRCFYTLANRNWDGSTFPILMPIEALVGNSIRQVIHLPGLRGNPERTYPLTSVGSDFRGTFEKYVASVIDQWQKNSKNNKLIQVNRDLARLGLTNKVVAKRINEVQIELLVNRFLHSDRGEVEDMVNIADGGLGISQALQVVVALQTAKSGQLVYIEHPEIHLHPHAQYSMAEVLSDTAIEGKRLVVETHSALLLRGIQTLVAERKLPPEFVKLHWFTQQDDGSTQITSADLDETGAFGNWPEDFHTVTLNSESRYLDAAEARLMGE